MMVRLAARYFGLSLSPTAAQVTTKWVNAGAVVGASTNAMRQ